MLLPLEPLEFARVKGVIPANIDEDLDAAVELEQRLRSRRIRLCSQQGCEVEHIVSRKIGSGRKRSP